MNSLPYTINEVLDYFDQINCIQDVSVIADYLMDNEADYTPGELITLRKLLRFYVELFEV